MRFSDGENGKGCPPGATDDAPPTDFGRRRVARILNREKPLYEQKIENVYEAWELVEKAMEAHRHHGPYYWQFGTRLDVLVLCDWRRVYLRGASHPSTCHGFRKGQTANLNAPSVRPPI